VKKRTYRAVGAEGFELAKFIDPGVDELVYRLSEGVEPVTWASPDIEIVNEDDGCLLRRSDFPSWGFEPLFFREGARAVLEPLVQDFGRWFLVNGGVGETINMFLANQIDALNLSLSEVMTFPDGRIMHIRRPVLNGNAIDAVPAFRLPGRAVSLYVDQSFLDLYQHSGLVGLDFEAVEVVRD
jgi:hypothetical protein